MSNLYAKFTENNHWEGETWHSWIPLSGNEETLKILAKLLDSDENESYELDLTPTPEPEVDILIKHGGDTDYMAAHTKLDGILTITPELEARIKDPEDDPLYKGGIRDLMANSAR